ncbi:hypothetical protein ACJJTC_001190 [Scirpophaga incertulas]
MEDLKTINVNRGYVKGIVTRIHNFVSDSVELESSTIASLEAKREKLITSFKEYEEYNKKVLLNESDTEDKPEASPVLQSHADDLQKQIYVQPTTFSEPQPGPSQRAPLKEISFQQSLSVSTRADLEGFQDHGNQGRSSLVASYALVFMIAGIRKTVKQPVAYYFSSAFSTADRLAVLIKEIEADMENYVKYKLVGGRLKLKNGIVSHKFQCQQEKVDISERSAVQKRNKIKYFEKLLSKDEEPITSTSEAKNKPEELFVACCEDEIVTEDPLSFKNNDQCLKISKKSKGVQVKLRDKGAHKSTMTDKTYFKKERKTISCPDTVSVRSMTDSSSTLSTHEMYTPDKDFLNPDEDLDSDVDNSESEKHVFRNYMQKAALLCISREPQLLLGLPKECYFLINLLSETTKCTPRNIMMTLKKIRLHQPNAILALDFGLATSSVTKIIRITAPVIASVLKSLVYFPASSNVQMNLPIPFRKIYNRVQSIIDCFEIQIEKPVDAVKQALTWSDYKGCNTIKYLISITPDGLINFISPGYGGRATDSLIFEDCGILHTLPKGTAILADRGFKNIW